MARPRKSPSPSEADGEVLNAIRDYFRESEQAFRTRKLTNRRNYDVYLGNQDWSYKQEGQSTEWLPKLAGAAEQMSAFVKRALVSTGRWFSMDLPREAPITPDQAVKLLQRFLDRIAVGRGTPIDFATLMGDAVKQGLLESLIVLKIHGHTTMERNFKVEPGNLLAGIADKLVEEEQPLWRLRIDLIPSEDYYPDPTGRGLYEIHEVERDFIDVLEMAEDGVYDMKVVEMLDADFSAKEREARRLPRTKGQDESQSPPRRRRVQLRECWGTLLGPDGRPLKGPDGEYKNIVCTVANDKYIIRQPTPNPFWHRESPIVAAPVVRVPHSVSGKALFDHAAELNIALSEYYNLILDGGIASVWGVRQVRADLLEDPRQISNGIPQNATLTLAEDAPMDAKVVETVSTGKVPPEAIQVYQITDREFQTASFTNDIRLGNLPQRQVKATELVQADQSAGVIVDSFAGDLERAVIEETLRKAWMTVMQFADDIPAQEVVDAIGVGAAFRLSRMSPEQRFASLASGLGVKATGLSGTLARAREFQKLMAAVQGVSVNPVIMEAFVRRVSGDKALDHILRSLNIDPEALMPTEEEMAELPQRVDRMAAVSMLTGGKGSPAKPEGGGDAVSQSRSEIAQDAEPTGGV